MPRRKVESQIRVQVEVREEPPTPAQLCAWDALWRRLLAPGEVQPPEAAFQNPASSQTVVKPLLRPRYCTIHGALTRHRLLLGQKPVCVEYEVQTQQDEISP